jgi:O-succinylhomoserine sulfhydrylase
MTDHPLKVTQSPEEFGVETRLVRGGLTRSSHGEMSEGIFLTQGFVYDSAEEADSRFGGNSPGFMYSRYANPTLDIFERRMAALEGAEACHGTASGMAAVYASLACFLKAGDHVVAARALFGSCFYILNTIMPRFGVETTFVDGPDIAAWTKAVRPNTKAFFLETPANPTLELIDIEAVAKVAKSAGATFIVDNVFASPILQKPLALGADVVVYSATKHIDGQGRCLGGAVLGTAQYCSELLQPFLRHTGPALSPFNAWVLLKGLETLSIRVERQQETSLKIATELEKHPEIALVRYPYLPSFPQYELAKRQMTGGSTLVTFEIKGGREVAFAFMNALQVIDISNNLGDAKSIITHPMTTTHRAIPEEDRRSMGITEGLVRLSVGLETASDLIADLERGIAAARAAQGGA